MQPSAEGREELQTPEQQAQGLARLVDGADRIVRIVSDRLDPALFDNQALADALSAVARKGRQCEVRILVHSTALLVKRRHRLIELHRRLVSSMPIRRLAHVPETLVADFVLVDDHGLFWIPRDEDKVCYLNSDDRPMVKHLIEQFDDLWSRSQPDPELRVMPM